MIDPESPEFGSEHALPRPTAWIGLSPDAIAASLADRAELALLGPGLAVPSGWPDSLFEWGAGDETVSCFTRSATGAREPFFALPVWRALREAWCFLFARSGDPAAAAIEPAAAAGIRDGVCTVVRDLTGLVERGRKTAALARWLGLDPPAGLRYLEPFTACCRSGCASFVFSQLPYEAGLSHSVSMSERRLDDFYSPSRVDVNERGCRICGGETGGALYYSDVWGGRLPVRFVDESGRESACALVVIENWGAGASVRVQVVAHEPKAVVPARATGGRFVLAADGDLRVVDREGRDRARLAVQDTIRQSDSDSPYVWLFGQTH